MRTHRKFGWLVLWRDNVGAAMVEFTLLAPFLLFLGLGMNEFGRFLYQYHLVLDGLRDGARYLARMQDPNNATSKTNAANLAATGTIDGSGAQRVTNWVAADVTFNILPFDNSAATYRGPATIYRVQASTTFDYQDIGFLGALDLPAISIAATHMQRAIKE